MYAHPGSGVSPKMPGKQLAQFLPHHHGRASRYRRSCTALHSAVGKLLQTQLRCPVLILFATIPLQLLTQCNLPKAFGVKTSEVRNTPIGKSIYFTDPETVIAMDGYHAFFFNDGFRVGPFWIQ